ncbi:MAG: ribonuclease H [Desulfobacterales bacterium]|jgi:ribonuclease HI
MSRADSEQLKWRRMRFKNNKVWQAMDTNGRPLEKNGKVLIKYQLEQDYEYWVNPANLGQIDTPVEARPGRGRRQPGAPVRTEKAVPPAAPNTVHIYTDGASSGNPGPSGIGVVLQYGEKTKEISKFIGNTTNNVAELEAIRIALMKLKRRNLPVRIYTDSSYAQGVLSFGWKAQKNKELVEAIRELLSALKDVTLIKVRGHSGHEQNERADQLARAAIVSVGRRYPP